MALGFYFRSDCQSDFGVLWGFVAAFAVYAPESYQEPLVRMAQYGVIVNAIWVAFSLIPILPWDGGIFIDTFLSAKQSMQFRKIEPYGMWIVLILMFTGLLAKSSCLSLH